MKRKMIVPLLMSAMILGGCGSQDKGAESVSSGTVSSETAETESVAEGTANTSDMFTDRDMEIGYDEETSAKITFSGDSASCDSSAVEISGERITITDEGTYILSGTLNSGMVVVDAEDTDKVQLVLNGTDITSPDSAAIYIRQADKVFITTVSETKNTLSNSGEYETIDENNIDGVIFSKSDLTLNGEGLLTVHSPGGHGIVSKDDLVLTSGTYDITAESHGLSGKDSVRIGSGVYTIASGKDGIHAENEDDSSLGFLYVADGTFTITADGDGMSAGSYLLAENGQYQITAGGGSPKEILPNAATDTEDAASTKGMKAGTELTVKNGTYSIDSADDALHSNGDLTIAGGTFEMASGDDGIHADSAVVIADGAITISQSYEGIEGLSVEITGGEISLAASDDGLNAAGGTDGSGSRGRDMFAAEEGAYIKITGGTLHINAEGDGIDSNGDLTIAGGETYVSGPTNSGNGILDYNGEAIITGGIFAGAGSMGMAENFGDSSTQGSMLVAVEAGTAGSTVSLADSSGKELVSWQPDKEYSCVIISTPEIIQGSAYTLTADGTSTEITMDSLIYGTGGMGGGFGKGGGFGRGGYDRGDGTFDESMRPDGRRRDGGNPPDGNNPPDGGRRGGPGGFGGEGEPAGNAGEDGAAGDSGSES